MAAIQTTSATFQINNTKFYVLFVTFSINDNIKFLENVKQRFKRTISWNKYRSEITTQKTRNSFDMYYKPLVKIKIFIALIDNKPFFDQPVKNKQEPYEKRIGMWKNDDYTTGNLLDYLYHQKYYKVIGINLSRQKIRVFLKKLNLQEN